MSSTGIPFLDEALEAATGTRDLARRLGIVCLDENATKPRHGATRKHMARLSNAVAASSQAWPENCAGGGLKQVASNAILSAANELAATPGLAALAFLEGLCVGGVGKWFAHCYEVVPLFRGDPFPLPNVDVPSIFPDPSPDAIGAIRADTRLADVGFQIFSGSYRWPVRLSFVDRHNLDANGWSCPGGTFPSVIVHAPFEPKHLTIPPTHVTAQNWWGVRPEDSQFRADAIVNALIDARDEARRRGLPKPTIAVLPEMSLPTPDALEEELRRHPREVQPELIVAGSSHPKPSAPQTPPNFNNETIVYLNGARLFSHRKVHPFRTKDLGLPEKLQSPLPERLDGPDSITIASGTRTRLAVLICADLIDAEVSRLVEELCVNLLVVPTLSFNIKGMPGGLNTVATMNQGVAVSVNEVVAPANDPDNFTVLHAVTSRVSAHTHEARSPTGRAPSTALFVPQAEPNSRIEWL